MCVYATTDILFIHLTSIEKETKIFSKKYSHVTYNGNRATNNVKYPKKLNCSAILIYWKKLAWGLYGKRKLQCALPLLVCYAVLYNRDFLY